MLYNYLSFQEHKIKIEDMKVSTSMENYCFQRAKLAADYFGINVNCNGHIFKQAIKNPGDYINYDKDVKLYDYKDKCVWEYWIKTIRMLACYSLKRNSNEL